MMAGASNAARLAAVAPFTPKDTVPVKLGETTLYVYQRVDAT
jgi:hypothetical protein